MRILIILGLIYLGIRAVKNLLAPPSGGHNQVRRQTTGEIDDVMVKDPHCQVYFPQREGVPANIGGRIVYFCSEKCRDEYLRNNSKGA